MKSRTQDPGGANYSNGGVFFDVLLIEPDVDLYYPNPDGQPYNFLPCVWNSEQENPIYQLWKEEELTTRNRVLGTYSAKYNFTSWLNLEAKYAFEYSTDDYSTYYPYDGYTRAGNTPVYSLGSLYLSNSNLLSQNAQTTLNFNKKFGDFNTRAKLSYLFEKQEYTSNSATGYDFSLAGIPSMDAIAGNKTSTSYIGESTCKELFCNLIHGL